MVEHKNDINSDFEIFQDGRVLTDEIEDIFRPNYIPRKYSFCDDESIESLHFVESVYMNKDQQRITVSQYTENSRISLDTEDTYFEWLEINGNEAYFLTKNEESTLIWFEHGYLFLIDTNFEIGLKELKKIAESLN